MSTESRHIVVSGVTVQVDRKPIKNLHLGVYPPQGRVRVAAPRRMSDNAVRLAIVGKLGWIKRQQAKFEAQPRESPRQLLSGESHYYLGRRYRLRVINRSGPLQVTLRGRTILEIHAPHGATRQQRETALRKWYRQHLNALIPALAAKWQTLLGLTGIKWGIRRMKTRWGTCNCAARRVWLNLELAKKPERCLEYVMVHELMHFFERHHDDRFVALMDRHVPHWRRDREELNAAPLAHYPWGHSDALAAA